MYVENGFILKKFFNSSSVRTDKIVFSVAMSGEYHIIKGNDL